MSVPGIGVVVEACYWNYPVNYQRANLRKELGLARKRGKKCTFGTILSKNAWGRVYKLSGFRRFIRKENPQNPLNLHLKDSERYYLMPSFLAMSLGSAFLCTMMFIVL